ncbi:MAG: hypothetical protein Q8M44_04830, partial [bacterium]|nr:hypothetical protein [bacterium]
SSVILVISTCLNSFNSSPSKESASISILHHVSSSLLVLCSIIHKSCLAFSTSSSLVQPKHELNTNIKNKTDRIFIDFL